MFTVKFGGKIIKQKMSMRDAYAKKILNGEKSYKPLKRTALKSKSSLKSKKSLSESYCEKIKSGEKTIKKTVVKTSTPKSRLFSIFTHDLTRCHITEDTRNIHIHHIFGASNKANSEKYGFIVPLRADWHDMADYGIHFDNELNLKYKRECQEYWLTHYGTKEEFIKTFFKWW